MDQDRNAAGRLRTLSLAAACAGLVACASATTPGAAQYAASPIASALPVSVQAPQLSLRADARELTPLSVNLTIELVVKASWSDVSVSASSDAAGVAITPPTCRFRVLAPPIVPHASHPPYPLPAVPLCSLVVSATHAGRYPVILRVRDAAGRDLVAPIHTVIVIKGS